MKKRLVVLFVLSGLLVPGCRDNMPQKRVRLGISAFQDTLLPILAAKRGWFREEGLDVEIVILGWQAVQESLAAKAIDVGINNISAVVSTYAAGPGFVYAYGFNTFDDGFALMVRPDGKLMPLSTFLSKGLQRADAAKLTAAQLKGKTVITTSNTDMEQGVAAAAKRGGLNFQADVQILNLPPADGLAAFIAGQGDAYIGGIPQRAAATRQGMVEMLTGADIGPAPINGFVTTKEFAETQMPQLLALIKVWFRVVDHVNNNLSAAAEEMAAELNKNGNSGFTPAEFKQFWNKLEHYPANPREVEEDILRPTGRNYWKARWDDCNDYFFDVTRRIPAPVKPEGVFIMHEVQRKYLERYGPKSDAR